jgi:hypothetical protein
MKKKYNPQRFMYFHKLIKIVIPLTEILNNENDRVYSTVEKYIL